MFAQLCNYLKKIYYGNITHLVSFPKSGRTWLEVMFAKAYADLTGLSVSNILNHKKPLFNNQNREKLPFVRFGHGHDNPAICRNISFPVEYYKNNDVILLVRDPRAVLVSFYHFEREYWSHFGNTLSDFISFEPSNFPTDVKAARYGLTSIINYMNQWIMHSSLFKSFSIIYYEDFLKDVRRELSLLFQKVGLEISESALTSVIDYGSIKNMKKLEMTNELNWYGLRKGKVRKGKSASYREELSKNDLRYIDTTLKQKLDPFFSRYMQEGM